MMRVSHLAAQTTLATSLAGLLAAGLEGTRGGLATLRGDLMLLVGVHAGEATRVAGLAALGGDFLNFLLGSVGEVTGVAAAGVAVVAAGAAVAGLATLGGDLADLFLGAVGEVSGVGVLRHGDVSWELLGLK